MPSIPSLPNTLQETNRQLLLITRAASKECHTTTSKLSQTLEKLEATEKELWYYKWLCARRRRRMMEKGMNIDEVRVSLLERTLEFVYERRKCEGLEREVYGLRRWKGKAEEVLRGEGLEGVVEEELKGRGRKGRAKGKGRGEGSIISESASRFTESLPWEMEGRKGEGKKGGVVVRGKKGALKKKGGGGVKKIGKKKGGAKGKSIVDLR